MSYDCSDEANKTKCLTKNNVLHQFDCRVNGSEFFFLQWLTLYATRWPLSAAKNELKCWTIFFSTSIFTMSGRYGMSASILCYRSKSMKRIKLVTQSQIVQSVTQDCQYVLSHLLPVCNLLVQGQLLFVKTVLNFTVVFYVEFRSF